jgi:hypothetical protein
MNVMVCVRICVVSRVSSKYVLLLIQVVTSSRPSGKHYILWIYRIGGVNVRRYALHYLTESNVKRQKDSIS